MPDLLDDELAPLFASFRAEATRSVRPAELDQVRVGARARRRRERTVRAVAGGVMSVAVLGAGLAVAQPLGVLPGAGDRTPESRAAISPNDLLGKRIDLPPWPDLPGWPDLPALEVESCPRDRIDELFQQSEPVGPSVILDAFTIVDVNGDRVPELVALLSCRGRTQGEGVIGQVVAFAGEPGGELTVLGQVATTSQDALDIVAVTPGSEEGTVTVVFRDFPDSAIDVAQAQERTYAFDGGKFRQVDGPTEFGPNPDVVDLVVTADPLVMRPDGTGATAGTMRIVIRNVGPGRAKSVEIFMERPSGFTINDPTCWSPGADSTTYTCELGPVAPGDEPVLTFDVAGPEVVSTTHLFATVTAITSKGRLAEANLSDNFVDIPVVAG